MSTPETTIPDGGPAFPPYYTSSEGMSLRDWFAGQALSDCQPVLGLEPAKDIADYCYTVADAMLERRLK